MLTPAWRCALLILVLSAQTMADMCGLESDWRQWYGECKSGDQAGEEFSEASTCSCKDGKMHGRGWYRETGSMIYSGEMVNGQYSGTGWMRYKHDSLDFKGEYVAGNRTGLGRLKLRVGTLHASFVNDRAEGLGVEFDSLENTYSGQYKNGYKHGFGVQDFHGLWTYYGEWQGGKRVGCGQLVRGYKPEAILWSVLLGRVREGTWVPCLRAKECKTGLYCRCDDDAVRLLAQKNETYRQCVDDAKAEAIRQSELALAQREKIDKDIAGVVWPGGDVKEFLNVTKTQLAELMARSNATTKTAAPSDSSRRRDGDDDDDDDDDHGDEDELGAALMADVVTFTALLSLVRFLRDMFQDKPGALRLINVIFAVSLVGLYEKAVGWKITIKAIHVTYLVFTGQDDEELDPSAHSEL